MTIAAHSLWLGSYLLLILATGGHVLLHQRDPRAAWGWIAVCVLFPLFGPALYLLFGVNRIQTRAQRLGIKPSKELPPAADGNAASAASLLQAELRPLARTAEVLTGLPLLPGNRVEILHNGEQAYPRMLAAIEQAQESIALATYLFDTDVVGRQFIDALTRARERGVAVRCLVDGLGECYSSPRASTLLKHAKLSVARFNPLRLIPPALHINLRNHRKLLLVDGRFGFTGGMNIGRRHMADDESNPHRVSDLHFALHGPIIAQLQRAFAEDWRYASDEDWQYPQVAPNTADSPAGASICRVVTDGPNEDLDHLRLVLLAAIAAAQRHVFIMTPYFLPSGDIVTALQSAALRGVDTSIILPARNNIPIVDWASHHILGSLLERGVRIYYRPPPFAHSKLLLVDECYAQIGSANMDARSLRLNFELIVETYDEVLTGSLARHFEAVRVLSRAITVDEVAARSLAICLRDAACWLFSPYL